MTYAIGQFIFGLNLKDYNNFDISEDLKIAIDDLYQADILESSYSGSGDQPLFLGIEITDIDECNDIGWDKLAELKEKFKAAMEPDSSQNKEYQTKLQVILDNSDTPDEAKEWFKAQKPEVFLTWGTS